MNIETPTATMLTQDRHTQTEAYQTGETQQPESAAVSKKLLEDNSSRLGNEVEKSYHSGYPGSCLGADDEEDDDDVQDLLSDPESMRIDSLRPTRPVSLNRVTSNHPLPRTGHIFQDWHLHSSVDENTGQMFIQRDIENQICAEYGLKWNPSCHWVRLSNPGLVSRPGMPANIPPTKVVKDGGKEHHPLVPELKLTTPEGQDFWLDDLTYYPGETNWEDSEDDEDT